MKNVNLVRVPKLQHLTHLKTVDFSQNQLTLVFMDKFPVCVEEIVLDKNPIIAISNSGNISERSLKKICLKNTKICEVSYIMCIVDIVKPSCIIDLSGCNRLPHKDLSIEFQAKYFPYIKSYCRSNKDEHSDTTTCAVCLHKTKDVVFLPCKHMCACNTCSTKLSNCPICRKPVQTKVHVFLS